MSRRRSLGLEVTMHLLAESRVREDLEDVDEAALRAVEPVLPLA
jgi:hypothetical protein